MSKHIADVFVGEMLGESYTNIMNTQQSVTNGVMRLM